MHDTTRDVEKVDSGENNARDRQYIRKVFRKTEKRKKNRKIKINVADIGENLYFVICYVKGKRDNDKNRYFKTLVDTGVTNSLMHTSVAKKFGIKYKPIKLTLKTATGVDEDAIKEILSSYTGG